MSPSISRLPLSEVCEVNPRDVHGLTPETTVTFVPMSAVDEKTGSIVSPEIRCYQEVAKGYTPFRTNDVLFAKITPCMENGKCAIASDLENGWGFGSTEFHILRASENVVPEFVYYFMRQDEVRQFAANNMTGTAGQQRVPKSIFDRLLIPIPPLTIQKKIAAILEKADAAREKRRQANKLTEQFLQSVFLEMFGDPVTNPKGWECFEVQHLCDLVRGSSPRPKSSPKFYGGPIPRLMIEDITRDGTFVTPQIDSLTVLGSKQSRPMKAGEVVMAVSGAVGLPAILKIDACIHDGFVGFRNLQSNLLPIYLVTLFHQLRVQNALHATGAIWKNLNTDQIKKWRLPIPPAEEQKKYATTIEKVNLLRAKQQKSEKELDDLFGSLMQRAFSGEFVG